jgi:hypothetical protein
MLATRRTFALSTLATAALAAPTTAKPKVKPMRILILGGTGFIGPHQVRYALSRGHKVTVFNRGRRPDDFPPEVEELVGDRNTSDLKALEGKTWDVCIDNPTTLPFWVRDAAKVLKGNIGHYLFVSTMSVYATNDKPGEDETAPTAAYTGADAFAERGPVKPELYGPLKAVSEAEARAQFGAAETAIVRPGLIVGPGDETDRFTYWPVRLGRGGEVRRRATGATRSSTSTPATSPSGRSGWWSSARPERSMPSGRRSRSPRGGCWTAWPTASARGRPMCGRRQAGSRRRTSAAGATCRSGCPARARRRASTGGATPRRSRPG